MNRNDFPILKNGLIYFDNGATTLKPQNVIDSINDYYLNYSSNIDRGEYDISFKADEAYNKARENVAKFINANTNEIVFTSNATDSLNYIVNGYFKNILKSGDEVLLTQAEHASNILPWFNLSNEIGITLDCIPLDDNYHVTLDNVIKMINDKTKVISLAGISNVIGDIRPIKEITKYAHEHGIYVVVDGAQSVPHIKTDVKDLDIDFLAFSAHKMLGPTGVGIMFAKDKYMSLIKPLKLGGGMNESFDSPDEIKLKEYPKVLEAGTPNIAGVISTSAAVDYLNKIGMDNIQEYESNLKAYAVSLLSKYHHIHILNTIADSGIISFYVDNIFSQDVGYYLNKYHICVRTGNHCAKLLKNEVGVTNTVRVSLYFYNTKEEIDKLAELLSDPEKIRK
ncbi:MAG TPA: cysteine desulfurase, partial [Bacilli bacterium]|nr:cysteine desulfurase [Bacilli bacterium]